MPKTPKTPKGVLSAAARYIEKHGWNQGDLVNSDGQVCLYGGINAVLTGNPEDERATDLWYATEDLLKQRIVARYPDLADGSIVVYFNDDLAKSQEQVLEVLRG